MVLREKISNFLGSKKERLVVILETSEGLEVSIILIDNKKKRITLKEKYLSSNIGGVKKPLIPIPTKAVIAASPKMATTVEDFISLKRDSGSGPIKESEVDTIIFKAFWAFLNRYRPWAAEKMSINELDLVLAEANVKKMLINGHEVINPAGFEGRDITLFFRATFVPRKFLDVSEKISTWANEVRIVEGPAVFPVLLGKDKEMFLSPMGKKTVRFDIKNGQISYEGILDWGFGLILNAIADTFCCELSIAKEIFDRYTEKAVSKNISRVVERVLRKELDDLEMLLEKNLKHSEWKGEVVLVSSLDIPSKVVNRFRNFKILYLGDFSALKFMEDYDIDSKEGTDPVYLGKAITFAEFVYSKNYYEKLNHLLIKRAGWLIAASRKKQGIEAEKEKETFFEDL